MESGLQSLTALIPFLNFRKELAHELFLKKIIITYESDSIFLIDATDCSVLQNLIWAQDIWMNCQSFTVSSMNQAIDLIKKYKYIGCYYPLVKNNFGASVSKKIRNLNLKRITYQYQHPFNFKFTAWTMIDNKLIISEQTQKRFPFGWHEFNEDKMTPPNRAYLKLWELLTVYNIPLTKNDVAIEVGSSPGGWTWVLSSLINKIYSIDRAPLSEKISKIKNIQHFETDAFKLGPENYPDATWFFSDLICTPDKIYETILFWMRHSPIQNYICTIKFKGDYQADDLKKFLDIEHSQIIHLYHNKNEVTWIRTPRLEQSKILIKDLFNKD
jgi:23S rRNA (cytidine2498-2'-O)-methyltransferase